jgi:large repetitive protein
MSSTAIGRAQPHFAPDGVGGGGGNAKAKLKSRFSNGFTLLEPRVLFDAAGAATFDAVADDAHHMDDSVHDTAAHDALLLALDAPMPLQSQTVSSTLVFIDATVEDIDVLISDIGPDAEIYVLNAGTDGVEQIASVLQGRSDISSLHIISHGSSGALSLGSSTLTQASMAGQHADEMAVIRAALASDADILLYGCDFAAGELGRDAVQALADATGADVAASEDLTGAANLGGNWVLEDTVGQIESRSFAATEWSHTLAPLNIVVVSQPVFAGDSGVVNGSTGQLQGGVGMTATFVGAGTVGSTTIDLRGTVVSLTGAGQVSFLQQGDDASIFLTAPGTMQIKWEMFATGTNIAAVGSPNFRIVDIDGAGGVPNSREIVVPQLQGLTGYTLDAGTHLVANVSGTGVSVSGTQNETANPPTYVSLAMFSWQNVSSWTVDYTLMNSSTNALFRHDGNGGFTFNSATAVSLLSLDLDGNNSTASGTSYDASYVGNAAAIRITDVGDTLITQNAVLGTSLGAATVVLTNAQANDVFTLSTLPSNITASIDTSVGGKITVNFSGTDTLANYQLALQALKFSNASFTPNTTDRVIEVSVTNTVFDTTSAPAISTIHVAQAAALSVDLDTNDSSTATGANYKTTYTENAVAAGVLDTDAQLYTPSGALNSLQLVVGGRADGASEIVNVGGTSVALNANQTVTTVSVAGVGYNLTLNYVAATGTMMITRTGGGTISTADMTTIMQAISYRNGSDNPTVGDRTLTMTLTDSILATANAVATVSVVAVNDAPSVTAPASYAATANSALALTGLSFADPDIGSGNATVTLKVGNGTLLLNSSVPGGLTAGQISGNGTGTITITAPLATINATLGNATGLSYTSNTGFGGVDTLAARINDNGGSGTGGALQSIGFATVNVANTGPAATLDVNSTNEDTTLNVVAAGVLGNDTDAQNDPLTVYAVNGATANVGTAIAGSGGGLFTVNANGSYTFNPNGQFESLINGQTATTQVSYTAASPTTVFTFNTGTTVFTTSAATGALAAAVGTTPVVSSSLPHALDGASGNLLTFDDDPLTQMIIPGIAPTDTIYFVDADDGQTYAMPRFAGNGTYTLTTTFNVADAASIRNAVYNVLTYADDSTTVIVNGVVLGTSSAAWTNDAAQVSFNIPDGLLVTGANTISFQVNNVGGATGLWARGTISAETVVSTTLEVTVTGVNDTPMIDLNSTASGADVTRGTSVTFTEGDAPVKVALLAADVNDASENDINTLTIVLGGVADGNAEKVTIAGTTFDLATVTAPVTVIVGASILMLSYDSASKTFTVTNSANSALPMAQADLDTLVRGITYENSAQAPTAGARTLTFTLRDIDNQTSAPAVATVTMVAVNDVPSDGNENVTVVEDTPKIVLAPAGLLANTVDVDGGTPTITGYTIVGIAGTKPVGTPVTIPNVGQITIGSDGSYTFSPASNYAGSVPVITYTVSDGAGGTDTSTLTIGMTAVNDAAVVIDPSNPGTALNPTQAPDPDNIIPDISTTDGATPGNPNVAQYFVDPDGDALTFTASGLPVGLTMLGDGTIVGSLMADASQGGNVLGQPGVYLVTVTADDNLGGQTTTTLTYTVTNPAPVAVDDNNTVDEDADATGNVLTDGTADHDGLADSDSLAVTQFVVAGVAGMFAAGSTATIANVGTLKIEANGAYTFTPLSNFFGAIPVATYTIVDADGATDTGDLKLTMVPANDPPVVIDPSNPGTALNPIAAADPDNVIPDVSSTDGATPVALNAALYFVDPDGDTLTFTATGLPPGLSMTSAGMIVGTLDAAASQGASPGEQPGTYVVVVSANDGNGQVVTTTVTYTVANIGPVAADDNGTIGEDAALTVMGNVMTGPGADSDGGADADTLVVAGVNGSAANLGQVIKGSTGGSFIVQTDGTWSFAPGADFQALNLGETRATTISYLVSDRQGGFSQALIVVTVTGANEAPAALGPIPAQTGVDGAPINPIDVGSVFENPDHLILTFTATGLPPGLLVDPATGIISGTLAADASLNEPYVVQVTANGPNGETATIAVQIGATDTTPTATTDNAQTPVDVPVVIAVLANDTDPDADPLMITGTAGPLHGSLTVNDNGTITYVPSPGYVGADSFTYFISDQQGGVAATTVTVNVGAVDGVTPTATAIAPQAGTDGDAFTPFSVAPNLVDPNGDPLTFTAVGLPPGLSIDPVTGVVSGTLPPDASVQGPYTVVVVATDPSGNQVTLQVIIAVANVGPAPAADQTTTPLNTPVVMNVLGNDVDVDGDPLMITAVTQPAHGSVVVNADGTVTYTPAPGYAGADSFTYSVSDGQGGVEIVSVAVNVGGSNPDAPTANPVVAQAATDGAAITPIDVAALAGVVDPNADPLMYSAVGLPPGLSIDPATGVISGTLTPDASGNGPYSVQVFAIDPSGAEVIVTFLLNVANVAPQASNDIGVTPVDQPLTLAILANDVDPDKDPATVTAVTTPAHGTVVINGNGTVTYTPTGGYVGPDTFSYTITDAQGLTATATITVNVGAPLGLAAPPAIGTVFGVDGTTIAPVPVAAIFADPDQTGVLNVSVDVSALPPGITFNTTTNQFEGTPSNLASQGNTPGEPLGTYIVPVTATDDNGGQITQFVTFSFSNLPPVAVDDVANVTEDIVKTGNVLTDGVADHDTAPDSDSLSVTQFVVTGVPGVFTAGSTATILNVGTLKIESNGTYTFTPAPNYVGPVPVATYTMTDGNDAFDTADLALTVVPVNDPPVVVDPSNPGTALNPIEAADPNNIIPDVSTTDGATPTAINAALYFVDPEGNPLSFTATGLPTGLSISGSGLISGVIDPAASQGSSVGQLPGTYVVVISCDDGTNPAVTTTVTYTISNLSPVAVDDVPAAGLEDINQTGNVLTDGIDDADAGPDSDPVTVVSFDIPGVGSTVAGATAIIPNVGTLTIDSLGNYVFDPAPNYDGAVPLVTYTISDGQGGTDQGTLALSITAVNDAPVAINPANPGTALNPIPGSDPQNVIPDVTATDGATPTAIDVSAYFVDPEGNPLTFTADILPPGLTLLPNGMLSGQVSASASVGGNVPGSPGVYLVTITANDGNGGVTTTTLTYTISNLAPVAVDDVAAGDEDTAQSGNVLTDAATGDADTGPDSDGLIVVSINGVTGNVNMPIDLTYGTLLMDAAGAWTFTPNALANRLAVGESVSLQVVYRVSDGQGGFDDATLSIDVTGVNDAPVVIAPPAAQTNNIADVVNLPMAGVFDRIDTSDVLAFSATGLPEGLSIDPDTGVISGTLAMTAGNDTPYVVVVTVDDGHHETTSVTLVWKVVLPTVPQADVAPAPLPLPMVFKTAETEVDKPVLRAVSELGNLNGLPTLGKRAVLQAADGLTSLNGSADLGGGHEVIANMIEWSRQQGNSPNWVQDLFKAIAYEPYDGDAMNLELTFDQFNSARVKTVLFKGALYVGVDQLIDGAGDFRITEAGGKLSDNVAVISAHDVVVNMRPGQEWIVLEVAGQLANGERVVWTIRVNAQSGEVIAEKHRSVKENHAALQVKTPDPTAKRVR